MQNKMKGRMNGISCDGRSEKQAGQCTRSPSSSTCEGPTNTSRCASASARRSSPWVPCGRRLNELPEDKDTEIICYCKISLRGYEAALVLEANGWKNVKVMEGGMMAWPYPREK